MQSIFSLLQRFVLSRAGGHVVGVIVLISLIWFAGPVVGLASVLYRIITIGVIIILAASIWGMRTIVTKRRGAKLQGEISGQDNLKATTRKLEIQLLKEKMNEAISSLKSSDLGMNYRGNAALYALPWYMIIGPSAAGKSTLLRQSGLHFPYARNDDIDIKGFGGTRNCDWWFSDKAVFLDTAGRYTTEDEDQEEWTEFLGMLYKCRKRMPIDGVIVAVSLAEILTADHKSFEWHVKIIRMRINELIRNLGLVFPVYLVLTKSDLLHGFEAFFEDLSQHDRNQVWGAYLFDKHNADEDQSEIFEANLSGLYGRLVDMRLQKLSMQRNLKRKEELFDFPNQFAAAAEKLNEFVNLLFKENPYQETPQFAGVYFTSATQEGTPIERVIGNLRQAFGMSKKEKVADSASQRPYFINDLFTKVILQIQGSVRASTKMRSMNRALKTTAVLASLVVVAGAYLVLSGSYATNTYLLNQGVRLSNAVNLTVNSDKTSMQEKYTAVVELCKHVERIKSIRDGMPWANQVALYRANEQIEMIERILDESLHKAYWLPSVNKIRTRLSNLSKLWDSSSTVARNELRPKIYEMLKIYLQLSIPEHFDKITILNVTSDVWRNLVLEGGVLAEGELKYISKLSQHFIDLHYEDQMNRVSSDSKLISEVRKKIYTEPDPSKLYRLLVSKGVVKWNDRSLTNFITGEGKGYLFSEQIIPGIYTADAWYEYVKDEISSLVKSHAYGDWVIGNAMVEDIDDDNAVIIGGVNKLNDPVDAAVIALENNSNNSVIKSTLKSTDITNEPIKYTTQEKGRSLSGNNLEEYLKQEMRAIYFKDYANAWISFLVSLKYRLPDNINESSRALMYLSSIDGPIAQLSNVIAHNTHVFETKPSPKYIKVTVDMGNVQSENDLIKLEPVKELVYVFSDLQRFSLPDHEAPISKSVSKYLEALSEVYGDVDELAASVDVKRDSEKFVSNHLSGRKARTGISKAWTVTTKLINGVQQKTRPILKSLLSPPVTMAWSGVLGQATSELEREWRSFVVKPYKNKIATKFPFLRKGDDAAFEDVEEFYRPVDGILWKFVNQRLSPYLRKTSKGWRPRRWQGVGANFSSKFIRSLIEAKKVTDVLYSNEDAELKISFYLQPDPRSDVREMQIESNGQSYRYRNGPQVWQRFDWPGDMSQIGARVMAIADHGRAIGELRADGPWGLFRLLTQADITKVDGAYYKSIWDLPASDGGTVSAAFNLRADREENIFDYKLIDSFNLPVSIFRGGSSRKLAAY